MFENFTEKVADGTLKAEPLSYVVSLFEEEQQELRKPEPPRQYNLQLDSKLTTTLAQMWQPGRTIYQDLDRCTFIDFLDTLLDKDSFNFYKQVEGRPLISPSWSFCLSYEFELRKEAIRLCKEQSFGIQAALWAALRDKEHRMKHWLQLVAIPNSSASSDKQELQVLKKRITDLEKARSRSPRRASHSKQSTQLALPGPSAPAKGVKGGKGSKKGKKGKGKGKSSSSFSASLDQ